ncbi:MAG: ribulokinase [Spirochaetes bacterium]|nr:ribulokinase [Spirochaetota bacterium]
MQSQECVLGIDFGTDSCRVVLLEVSNGKEIASHVSSYPRWKKGLFCNPRENRFRQHPLDYIEAMEEAVKIVLQKAGKDSGNRVIGIGIDTTGSTPCAVDAQGKPLCLQAEFTENPNAMFILWKDHTATAEAFAITKHAKSWGGVDFTRFEGGVYSAEWFWAKILHVFQTDPRVRDQAVSFMEHCDWMPALLTGTESLNQVKRSRCAAGHKAMWHREWGGYPSVEFLSSLHPELARIQKTLGTETWTSDQVAGYLTDEWAKKLGIRKGVPVAVGAYDAHMGAAGAGVRPGVLVKVMGTSTCDMTVGPLPKGKEHPVEGICGQVDGSILPGYLGYEAGQSAFGDVYAWFKSVLQWPFKFVNPGREPKEDLLTLLEQEASEVPAGALGVLGIDWMNGRRTPYANQYLKGALTGLGLGTDAPTIYRALIEATAFGAKAIVERFQEEGVAIESIIGIGGVAKKSPLVMQILSDVLQAPIDVLSNDQTVAIGAALFGALVGKAYPSAEKAQEVFVPPVERTYEPRKDTSSSYRELYHKYSKLGRFIEEELTETE